MKVQDEADWTAKRVEGLRVVEVVHAASAIGNATCVGKEPLPPVGRKAICDDAHTARKRGEAEGHHAHRRVREQTQSTDVEDYVFGSDTQGGDHRLKACTPCWVRPAATPAATQYLTCSQRDQAGQAGTTQQAQAVDRRQGLAGLCMRARGSAVALVRGRMHLPGGPLRIPDRSRLIEHRQFCHPPLHTLTHAWRCRPGTPGAAGVVDKSEKRRQSPILIHF